MCSEIIPMSRKIVPIKGFDPTSLLDTSGKWLLVTTKSMKLRAQSSFDDILEKCTILMTRNNPTGQVSKTNKSTDMISYAAMLTKDSTPCDLNKHFQSKSSLKIHFIISYDINTTNDFPNITNNN